MKALLISLSLLAFACGGGGGESPCGFAEDSYLPFEVGNTWTYQVTDVSSGDITEKAQSTSEVEPHPDYGDVLLQTTLKTNGKTESFIGRDGDRWVRFEQSDFDAADALEQRTVYDPARLRLDESEAHTTDGATWTEQVNEKQYDAADTLISEVDVTDDWEVLGVDVECTSPLGTFQCLHLQRTRTSGGAAPKEFYFAKGIGKIREVGADQVEELASCEAE